MTDNKIIETRVATIFWEDEKNGILFDGVKKDAIVTLDDAKELIEVYKNNFHHPNRKLLTNAPQLKNITKEAREYIGGQDGAFKYFNAIAFIDDTNLSVGTLIFRTLFKIIPLPKPLKIFTNKQDAINWLKSIK